MKVAVGVKNLESTEMILKYYKIIANHLWQIFGPMAARISSAVDALLDAAAQGWKTWREHTTLPPPLPQASR